MRKPTRKPKRVDPFYSSRAWHRVRTKALIRDGYKCKHCGANVRAKGASRVDHVMPRKKFPDMALHLPNLRTLCVPCDNARHARDRAAKGPDAPQMGADGFPATGPWAGLTPD